MKRPWSILTFNTSLKGSSAGIVSTTDVLTASDCTSSLPPDIDLALYLLANLLLGQTEERVMSAQESFPILNYTSFCRVLSVFLIVH